MDADALLEKAASLVRELGHFPRRAELSMKRVQEKSFPSEKTFRRYGNKPFFAKAIYNWCQGKEEWTDVRTLCEDLKSNAVETTEESEIRTRQETGFVYLMKSGKYYKIGRTNALDRRQYEIGMQLPEEIQLIHSIVTDDPSGIEAY